MSNYLNNPSVYQIGGSLATGFPTYVERPADKELYENIKAGNFCYVLAARQMGKSSLRVRIMDKLEQDNKYKCVSIDITSIGSQKADPEQWYYSFLHKVAKGLKLRTQLNTWWKQKMDFTPVVRLIDFFEEVVLSEIYNNVVIFVDEIDSLLSLDRSEFSTDDFFAAIRQTFNMRVDNKELNRLNFVILGVATPKDLMSDSTRTPFNIGIPIQLNNFTYEAARPLLIGFEHLPIDKVKLLDEIMKWTNGQPYLSQKLCKSIAEETFFDVDVEQIVYKHVDRLFLAPKNEDNDHNLSNINFRIKNDTKYNALMLGQYEQLISIGVLKYTGSDPQIRLRLTGLLIVKFGYLVVANKIYRVKFDKEWLINALQKIHRPYSNILNQWLQSNKDASALNLKSKETEEIHLWSTEHEDLSSLERQFVNSILANERTKSRQEKKRLKVVNFISSSLVFLMLIMAIYAFVMRYRAMQEKKKADGYSQELEILNTILENTKDSIQQKQIKLQWANTLLKYQKEESDSIGNVALYQRDLKDNLYQSLTILSQAQQIEISNPTLALQKAYIASKKATNDQVIRTLYNIYAKNSFYRTIKLDTVLHTKISSICKPHNFIVINNEGIFSIYNLRTGKTKTLNENQKCEYSFISTNGKFIALTSKSNLAYVFDSNGTQKGKFDLPENTDPQIADISPNGNLMAFASENSYGLLHNISSNENIQLIAHSDKVLCIKFSLSGNKILTGSKDKTAELWDSNGNPLQRFIEHTDQIIAVDIAPDEKHFATASKDNSAIIWESKEKFFHLTGHSGSVSTVQFSPNSMYLASGSFDKTARLWSLAGKEISVMKGHEITIENVSFNSLGTSLMTVGTNNSLFEWDLNEIEFQTLDKHSGIVNSLEYSADAKYLVSSSNNKELIIWNLQNNTSKMVMQKDKIRSIQISPQSQTIFVAQGNKIVQSNFNGTEINEFEKHTDLISAVHVNQAGNQIISGGNDKMVYIWNTNDNSFRTLSKFKTYIKNVAISNNNQYIAIADLLHQISIYNQKGVLQTMIKKDNVNTTFLKFTSDGKYIVANDNENTISYWNMQGKKVKWVEFPEKFTKQFISESMKYLVVYTNSLETKIYDMSGYLLQKIDTQNDIPMSVAFSPDEKFIAIGYKKGSIKIYRNKPLIDDFFNSNANF